MRRGEDCCSFSYHQMKKGGSEGEKLLPKQPCRQNSGSLVKARKFSDTEETNLSEDLITGDANCCFLKDF